MVGSYRNPTSNKIRRRPRRRPDARCVWSSETAMNGVIPSLAIGLDLGDKKHAL